MVGNDENSKCNEIHKLYNELSDLRQYRKIDNNFLNEYIDKTKDAENKFDSLWEKNRWHKQGEEPAPIGEKIIVAKFNREIVDYFITMIDNYNGNELDASDYWKIIECPNIFNTYKQQGYSI
jgi:hypothetical protein